MKRIAVLTSGGDAPGMNAAVRAVVRTTLDKGIEIYAIYEGFRGLVEGGHRFRQMAWRDVAGILQQGGTIIGSARCAEFRERPGRVKAAYNLIIHQIDGLIVIGGDGSLTGAFALQQEWQSICQKLLKTKQITAKQAKRHKTLPLVGLIGSIDNDMDGSDITIGADTALHRIVSAIDQISSTAASHQRSFIVEVMGRNCGYLALMGGLAAGADWVLVPENPPNLDDWESKVCEVLQKGRDVGRRDSIVVIAEGAQDRHGNPITSEHVKRILEERIGEDTRITVLGHVQRGGAPSAFDRNLSTLLGTAAVESLIESPPEPIVIGMRGNKITNTPMHNCLEVTYGIQKAVRNCEFEQAMSLRGGNFQESFRTVRTLVRAFPHERPAGQQKLRIAIMNAGGPSPGMNTAVRAAVRLGLDRGHDMIGIYHSFRGLLNDDVHELNWHSVNGWALRGGSELGTNRMIPRPGDLYTLTKNLEKHNIQALLMIGGWTGYESVLELHRQRHIFPAFNIPIVCLPASINNNLPGAELSVGADTALNSIVEAVDKIKQSAVASKRVFVVEVMGQQCGYLALMSALATGAERVYLPEEGVTLQDLIKDVHELQVGFGKGKRVGVVIRNEKANDIYTTDFIASLFEEEAGNLFDVRQAILGHLQQGGDPTPFDRILATRLASHCISFLEQQIGQVEPLSACVGQITGRVTFTPLEDIPRLLDRDHQRPKQQWWLDLRPIARTLAQSGPGVSE